MDSRTKTENGFLRVHPDARDKWRKGGSNMHGSVLHPACHLSQEDLNGVFEAVIQRPPRPPDQLLKVLWRPPFWKGWGLSRLICVGSLWGNSGSRGVGTDTQLVMEASSRWAGLIRGKALAWMCICMWACTWARLNVCMTLTRGRFKYKCCVRPPVLPGFLNIGRDPCMKEPESGIYGEHALWKTTDLGMLSRRCDLQMELGANVTLSLFLKDYYFPSHSSHFTLIQFSVCKMVFDWMFHPL